MNKFTIKKMKTLNKMPMRHLAWVPLMDEMGQKIEIIPYDCFSVSPEGIQKFVLMNKEDAWRIEDFCEMVSHNVFRIFYENENDPILVTPDWS